MITTIAELLAAQPILSLFLAVAVGYAVGQINIFGFSLGIGAVLFVGLAIGAVAPKAQIAGPIANPTNSTAPMPSEKPKMLIWPTA